MASAKMEQEPQEILRIPTNEEVIEELTKDLESSIVVEKTFHSENEGCKEQEDSRNTKSDTVNKDEFHTTCSELTVEDNEDVKDERKGANVDDFDTIDEEALKDIEVTYSDEEKQNLRKESEGFKLQGNEEFRKGEYRESAKLYTLGLRTCPLAFSRDRAIMYANRAAAKTKLELKLSAIDDCTKAVELDPNYLKAYFRRAQLYEETEKLDEALADYQKVLELDPLHREALYASKRLPEQIHERNEKMKAEMMGKLKDLGNMILRPFGLSTENFQLTQDPSSGGYSVSFKQNTT